MEHGERFNTISHLLGTALAVAGTIALVVISASQHDPRKLVCFSIYGALLTLLYLMSTLYHLVSGPAKEVFHSLDHLAVYLLIAGTYTPLTLLALPPRWGWTIFGIVWGLALLGIAHDLFLKRRLRALKVVNCLVMGWIIVLALGPLSRAITPRGVAWLLAGGVMYSIGTIFFGLGKKRPVHHAVWHVFVLLGSIAQYVALVGFVALRAEG